MRDLSGLDVGAHLPSHHLEAEAGGPWAATQQDVSERKSEMWVYHGVSTSQRLRETSGSWGLTLEDRHRGVPEAHVPAVTPPWAPG